MKKIKVAIFFIFLLGIIFWPVMSAFARAMYAIFIEPIIIESNLFNPPRIQKYKIRIEVEVDEDLVVGSGVIEITIKSKPDHSTLYGGAGPALRGEAIFVNLGSHGVLVMTLRDSGGRRMQCPIGMRNHMCQMVTFGDVADPTSLREVDGNNLMAAFGPSVFLKSISIEPTNEPVTWGLEKQFPWLSTPPSVKNPILDPNNRGVQRNLYYTYAEFIRR